MTTQDTKVKRSVNRDELKELGFSEKDIAAAVRMEELGLFAIEPSDDLLERTITRCRALLPDPISVADRVPERSRIELGERYLASIRDLSPAVGASAEWSNFSHVQGWQGACLSTLKFAHETRERPFIMLDNHNVIQPRWWGSDTGFRSFWNAAEVVNKIVARNGLPRAACFVILRPDPGDYSPNDLETIDEMIKTGTSDVWWIPYNHAGLYQARDLIVLGEDRVFELRGKPESPVVAIESFEEQSQHGLARGLRSKVRFWESLGKSIRAEGKLSEEAAESAGSNDGIQHLMKLVISDMNKAKGWSK
jgi:hypothetical protein